MRNRQRRSWARVAGLSVAVALFALLAFREAPDLLGGPPSEVLPVVIENTES